MTDGEREAAFRAARTRAVRRRTAILADTRAEIIRQLKLAQERIDTILAAQPTDYQRWSLTQLQREISRVLVELQDAAAAKVSTAAGEAWAAGQALVDAPLAAAGMGHVVEALPAISTQQLFAMRAFMTDRIKDVAVQAANRINTQLGLTLIGAQSPHEAIGAVRQILGEKSRERAFTIVRTELSRAYAVASNERWKLASGRVPGMEKEWRKSGKRHPRIHHAAMNGVRVPFDQPFTLHPPGRASVKLMFPHDPAAPAGETINCGCIALPRLPKAQRLAEGRYNRNQARDARGRWTRTGTQSLAADARANPTRQSTHDLGALDRGNVTAVRRHTGLDLAGYRRMASDDYLRHASKSHGEAPKEKLRGQRPLIDADYGRLPQIVGKPTSVSLSPKRHRGLPVIEYRKTIGADEYIYAEAVAHADARVHFVSLRVHSKTKGEK